MILLRVQRYKFSIYKKGVCTYEFMSIDFSFGRLNSVRENKKPCVKKIIFVCVKIYNQYVKIKEKVYVKNPTCAWKFWKKCTWNATSIREKNEKIAKKPFHAHFLFSRSKKKTLPPSLPLKNQKNCTCDLKFFSFFNIFHWKSL